ncbi:MAG: biotin transporter BioY [Alphaproteobacteria bacterium]
MKRIETPTSSIVLIAIFAAFLTVCNYLARIDIGPVPITLQMIPVMLAGAVLGSWRGAVAIIIVVLLDIFHIPTFPGKIGIGLVSSITFGYIIGWVFAAYIIGLIVPKLLKAEAASIILFIKVFIVCAFVGIVVVYFFGVLWAALFFGKSAAVLWKFFVLPFIIPDLIKSALVAFIIMLLHKYRVIDGMKF